MMRIGSIALVAMALAACGQQQGGPAAPVNQVSQGACALITQPDAVFGAGVQGVASADLPGADGSCSFASTDGMRNGDLILYSPQSLGSTAPAAQVESLTARWADNGVTAQSVAGVGDEARLAVGLPGDQAQMVFRKGGSVVTVVAVSGDTAMTGEQMVRAMAAQAAAAM